MKVKKQSVQGAKWRRLDNTAKIFPVIANENMSNVFRISVTLKETVRPFVLQMALMQILPEFEGFRVKLRRGFFWYYFETNKKMPEIEKEATYPCRFIDPHSSQMFLFRVSYYKCRINLEVFHALTDGMGAVNFLKALTYQYLALLENSAEGLVTWAEKVYKKTEVLQDVEDSYLKHYGKVEKKRYSDETAYQLSGEYLPLEGQNVIHGYIDLTGLKKVCREAGVSITKYLAALLIWSVYQVYLRGKPSDKPVAINLPINLRSFFASETTANFFAVTMINYLFSNEICTFEDVLAEVGKQMDEKIVKEKLKEIISYNVSNEKKWYVRALPLVVKKLGLSAVFFQSSKSHSLTLSNLGPVEVEEKYRKDIEHFDVIIGVSKRQKMKCGVCAFDGKVSFTFNSAFQDTNLQEYFFGYLRQKGISVELESNGNPDREHDRKNYPEVAYDVDKFKKIVNIFYLVLFALAAILAIINYATFRHTWWSAIAVASIGYAAVTIRYSLTRHANLAFKIVIQSVGAQLLLVVIDYVTGYTGWSVNYAIPSVILFDVAAIVFLIIVNRLNWQSYFMYQIAITIFSFIPLALWAFDLINRPLMAIITVIISVAILSVTILMGDRSVKKELIRRFHL